MRTLLALVESTEQLDFFSRLREAASHCDSRLSIITARWSDAFRARRLGMDVHLVNTPRAPVPPIDLNGVGEFNSGIFTPEQAQCYAGAFLATIERIVGTLDRPLMLLWGGGDTAASRALRSVADRNGWKHLYFDRSNIPGRMIVDPHGMNFESYLSTHPSFLDQQTDHNILLRIRTVLQERRLGTATVRAKKVNWLAPVDRIVSAVHGIPYRGPQSLLHRRVKYDTNSLMEGQIILTPLNHSFELRKVQSGIGFVREQLDTAIQYAQQRQGTVAVTLHPLEQERGLFDLLSQLRTEFRVQIRKESSSTLLSHSQAVVAANTTVALEALILGIPVVHVGRSMFRDMDDRRLSAYLSRYLIPVDPTSHIPISSAEFNAIIEREGWE
jgi:capsular polysaccharide export protein